MCLFSFRLLMGVSNSSCSASLWGPEFCRINLRFLTASTHRCLFYWFLRVGMDSQGPGLLSFWSVYNVWSGPRRLRWPDQGLVTPASPVRQLESPLGWSAVPQTVLRLSALLISSLVAGSDNETKLRSPVA
ncbi:hypothetical protein HID58_008673 [Brassica napus]|uniref:Secreted protein n=1 Tax=Brassica napus TaxID=3708 RepID=A0ABQ8DQD6_BRANA|nr:hypothetical protein HID58_008673 [Brassica napus]